MGAGWKAWKVTTVLWRQRKTLQSTSTTRFLADSINLCVTQFQGIPLGGGVSQRCKQRKIKTSSERWNKTTFIDFKFNINLSCRKKWFRKSRKSWNLGLQSSDQVDGGAGTEEVKMYPRKVQTPSNSSYFDFRWKGNRWCSTYPTTLSPCSCLLYLLSCRQGATYWQICRGKEIIVRSHSY